MKLRQRYEIPGFSRYYVVMPFAIISKHSEKALRSHVHPNGRGLPKVAMVDDDGVRRQRSIGTIAALAFHGQQPGGYVAHYSGGEITPISVKWQSQARVNGLKYRKIDFRKEAAIQRMYWERGLTQDEIAARLGISQATVSRNLSSRKAR